VIFESVQFSKNQVWPITLLVALACADIMSAKTFAAAKVRNIFDICKKREIFLRKNVEWKPISIDIEGPAPRTTTYKHKNSP
ncbi:MAG: hypothetical protein II692_00670, partial [Paludibacteraceae bacterium]|nr:hypothetical protein [Paludibacteraceae bacterium]